MKTKLKPGDLVYRVVDVDLPDDDGVHTWAIATATVVSASDRQIVLSGTHKICVSGTRFKPRALGSLFFDVEAQAVVHFLRVQRERVESADRAIKDAERAIAWVNTLYPDLHTEQRDAG